MAKTIINSDEGRSEKSVIITPTQSDIDTLRGFKEARWRHPSAPPEGHINYECLDCQFSSLWLDKIQKHVAEGDHPWAFPGGTAPSFEDTPSGQPEY